MPDGRRWLGDAGWLGAVPSGPPYDAVDSLVGLATTLRGAGMTVSSERVHAAVSALVNDVTALAPLAAQATKRSLNEIAAGSFDEARLREREALTLSSADFAEGRAAMAGKRKPCFLGR